MTPIERFHSSGFLFAAIRFGFCVLLISLVHGSGWATDEIEHTFLADLPSDLREILRADPRSEAFKDDPAKLLDVVLQAGTPYSFKAGPFSVETDRRWFATVQSDDPAGPILELRRWPGDSVLALYVLAGATPAAGRPHPVPGAKFEPVDSSRAGTWRWEMTIDSPFGARSSVWVERTVPGSTSRLAALLLPGDAGLGYQARFDLIEELWFVLDRVRTDPAELAAIKGLDATTPIVPPRLDSAYGEGSERADAWQTIEGADYSIGLPPGVRATRLDIGAPSPTGSAPGAVLWFRGRFVDQGGQRVVIGDGTHVGYVANIRPYDRQWLGGKNPPLGAPKATLISRESFHATESKGTGSASVWAERWKEPGFGGEWLVFRLDQRVFGVEVGVPMVSGRQSLSVFWLPLTWRGPGVASATPPLDPAERFGIIFDRFGKVAQKQNPFSEGYLRVPGLRLELPKKWWPSAMLRSKNGFPVHIVDGDGQTLGSLVLLAEGAKELSDERLKGWEAIPRPGVHRAKAVYRRSDGAWLYLTHEGYGFLLEPIAGAKIDFPSWQRMATSALVVLPRP